MRKNLSKAGLLALFIINIFSLTGCPEKTVVQPAQSDLGYYESVCLPGKVESDLITADADEVFSSRFEVLLEKDSLLLTVHLFKDKGCEDLLLKQEILAPRSTVLQHDALSQSWQAQARIRINSGGSQILDQPMAFHTGSNRLYLNLPSGKMTRTLRDSSGSLADPNWIVLSRR